MLERLNGIFELTRLTFVILYLLTTLLVGLLSLSRPINAPITPRLGAIVVNPARVIFSKEQGNVS